MKNPPHREGLVFGAGIIADRPIHPSESESQVRWRFIDLHYLNCSLAVDHNSPKSAPRFS
jgi:hypothetical protein